MRALPNLSKGAWRYLTVTRVPENVGFRDRKNGQNYEDNPYKTPLNRELWQLGYIDHYVLDNQSTIPDYLGQFLSE